MASATQKKKLSKEKEHDLIRAAQLGDQQAWHTLVHIHKPKIHRLAKGVMKRRFPLKAPPREATIREELESVGLYQLMEDVENFDFERDVLLWTFVEKGARWAMMTALRKVKFTEQTEENLDEVADADEQTDIYVPDDSTDDIRDIQQFLLKCLKDLVTTKKLIVLGVLHAEQIPWADIAAYLVDPQAEIGYRQHDGSSVWAELHRGYRLTSDIPKLWTAILSLFHSQRSFKEEALRQWFSRKVRRLRNCYPSLKMFFFSH